MEERLFKITRRFHPTAVLQFIKQSDGLEKIRIHEHTRGRWKSLELKEPCTPEFNDEMINDNRKQGYKVEMIERSDWLSLEFHLMDIEEYNN